MYTRSNTLKAITLLLTCFAGCSPAGGSGANSQQQLVTLSHLEKCDRYAPLLALRSEYRGLYLGELHGSMNVAQIVECFIVAPTTDKRDLVVSLEMFHNDRLRLSDKIILSGANGQGTGTPPIRALIARYGVHSPRIQFHYHDGYYTSFPYEDETGSVAFPVLPNPIVTREQDRLGVQLPIQNARERSIGDAVKSKLSHSTFVLALGGNLHASRATWTEDWGEEGRAGSYLPTSVATVKLLSSKGGQLRFCGDRPPSEGPSCDLYDISPKPDTFVEGQSLLPGDTHKYDFIFDVGTWRPIPPRPKP